MSVFLSLWSICRLWLIQRLISFGCYRSWAYAVWIDEASSPCLSALRRVMSASLGEKKALLSSESFPGIRIDVVLSKWINRDFLSSRDFNDWNTSLSYLWEAQHLTFSSLLLVSQNDINKTFASLWEKGEIQIRKKIIASCFQEPSNWEFPEGEEEEFSPQQAG